MSETECLNRDANCGQPDGDGLAGFCDEACWMAAGSPGPLVTLDDDEGPTAEERLAELTRERDGAMEALREFNHVEGESLIEVAEVAVSAYGWLKHAAESWERRAREAEAKLAGRE